MAHATDLLATKLAAPPPRGQLVSRPRLLEQLRQGLRGRLTLLVAPAGFGKTTLLTGWLASDEGRAVPAAWVSVDPADADPTRFWAHVAAAVDRRRPGVGEPALALLTAREPPAIEVVLGALVNELAGLDGELVLVLDDYHLVDAAGGAAGSALTASAGASIHRGMAFLVERLPPGVHLVLSTRADPPLPLARLRGRGELVELRADDLRFAPEEARAFLNETMQLGLGDAEATALGTRTEGWIAGLQLAGLALRRQGDPTDRAAFIATFAGSDRFVVDYLAEEVLGRQPAPVQEFLLRTAVLERLCGPLCDALTSGGEDGEPGQRGDRDEPGAPSGQAMLEALERANLFLVPLDRERRWYRYHHLFADVLRARLQHRGDASGMAALHRRASAWHEAAGLLPEAIRHALAAGAVEHAADLLERVAPAQFQTPVQVALQGWLGALPQAVVRARPSLVLAEAWRLLQAGAPAAAEQLVEQAERALAEPPRGASDRQAARDDDTRGEVAVIRAFLELGRAVPNLAAVAELAERALATLRPENATFRGMAGLCLGSTEVLRGEGVRGEATLAEVVWTGRAADAPHLAASASAYLSAAQRALGARRRALATAREALAWAADHRAAVAGRLSVLHLLVADLLREEDCLDQATAQADEALAGARRYGLRPVLGRGLLGLARVRQARGDLEGALAALDEARSLAGPGRATPGAEDGNADQGVLDAFAAQVWLAQGRLAEAARWAEAQEAAGPVAGWLGPALLAVCYACEHQRVAPAQVWLALARATGDPAMAERALRLLAEQARYAETLGLGWLRVKVRALEALAHAAAGDGARALARLDEALSLAEPEGYVRLFADEGAPMAALLTRWRAARARAAAPSESAYLDRLLRALAGANGRSRPTAVAPAPSIPGQRGAPGLAEQLSARELEVLRLIAAGRANDEIVRALVVAPSTVKTHVNNLFGKLGVASRTQALARARELDLLEPSSVESRPRPASSTPCADALHPGR